MKIIINNLALDYDDQGSGPVLVLLHGWQDRRQTFDALIPYVSGYRIIRLDLPGFGGSEHPPTAWRVDDYVECVAAFIGRLGLDVAGLVGHSMGGRIAISGLASGRLRASKLILIGAAGLSTSRTLRTRTYNMIAKIGKFITLIPPLSLYRRQWRERLYARAGSDYLGAGPLRGTYLNIINEDLAAAARSVTTPTLLIWGDHDQATPLAQGRRLQNLIVDSRLEVLPGGHFIHQDQPVRVARLMTDFV